ncbi:MAG: NAD(P)/FAD-dependent oxidoreductase [Gammaproteobacteria bacterium]|nr:NAD(P)/FAD-dependent oxidoreductase [Gammaproteobacteria bacterium]
MAAIHFDLIELGAGNAGMAVAGGARLAGQSVVVIEARDTGGTCPLRGCVPKQVLVAAAETLDHIATAQQHHIHTGPVTVDWPSLIERKQGFVDGVPAQFEKSLINQGIEFVNGKAVFVDGQTISVNDQLYQANKFVIATGSKSRSLPVPGFEHAITSDDILDMTLLLESIVFIGGGVIAFEFAHVLARASVKVTILEVMSRPLSMLDEDGVKNLIDETRRLGVEIITDANTNSIVSTKSGFDISFELEGRTNTISTVVVANGAGRVADIDELSLDAAAVGQTQTGIIVDEYPRSVSNPDVFVTGDVLATPQLSAVATYEGIIVAHNLTQEQLESPDYSSIPSSVFTLPTLASVGLTEAAATDKGLQFETHINDLRDSRSAKTFAENAAFAKVLVDNSNNNIVGAHLLGHGTQENIHIFAFAMKYGVTAKELAQTVYAYPTFASDIKFMV